MKIQCSCGSILTRKEHTRGSIKGIFSKGAHAGHREEKRWTYGGE